MLDQLHLVGITLLIAVVPFAVILMTSFTRISIILTFLKQALATSVPSPQIIVALSLVLTIYIMHPVLKEIDQKAVKPTIAQGIDEQSVKLFFEKAWPPLRHFMLFHTREKDLQFFLEMGNYAIPEEPTHESFPWTCVIPAFILSELRTAFMLGFLLFLPFLVIDMVVTSLLMSMGMVLLPPVMISFPFKILLFVIVDGWKLVIQQVVHGYH